MEVRYSYLKVIDLVGSTLKAKSTQLFLRVEGYTRLFSTLM